MVQYLYLHVNGVLHGEMITQIRYVFWADGEDDMSCHVKQELIKLEINI
jgi:hypothetical protein